MTLLTHKRACVVCVCSETTVETRSNPQAYIQIYCNIGYAEYGEGVGVSQLPHTYQTLLKIKCCPVDHHTVTFLSCRYASCVLSLIHIQMCIRDRIKGVISDLIGVLYLFCFHCTYDDRVDRCNNIYFISKSIKSWPLVVTIVSKKRWQLFFSHTVVHLQQV